MADGDGRAVITLAEDVWLAASSGARTPLDREALVALVQRRAPIYDKSQDGHYNLISALHKSVRGSDPDASLYWLARMLAGGEDPLYIARRLVRMAIEDIGLADPNALVQRSRRNRTPPMSPSVPPRAPRMKGGRSARPSTSSMHQRN
jgi:putative ATPase